MGHVLHGCARTTLAIRRELQNSKKSVRELAHEYNITENTVRKWRSRDTVEDQSHRPKRLQTSLTPEDKAIIITLPKGNAVIA